MIELSLLVSGWRRRYLVLLQISSHWCLTNRESCIMAAAIWGHHWQPSCVCFRSDNMAEVNIHTSKDQLVMHLRRCLLFYPAFFRFQFVAEHVPWVFNVAADAISRNNFSLFFSLSLFFSIFPQIPHLAIPQSVLDLLVTRRPNWGSREWTRLFACSLTEGSQMPHVPFISQAGGNTHTCRLSARLAAIHQVLHTVQITPFAAYRAHPLSVCHSPVRNQRAGGRFAPI